MAPLESRYFAAAATHAGAYRGEADLGFLEAAPRKLPLFLSGGTEDRLFPQSVVEQTARLLKRSGYPVTTALVRGGHGYRSSRAINERVWKFLEPHRLPEDPVFVPVQFQPAGPRR
jgi:predicted esterase